MSRPGDPQIAYRYFDVEEHASRLIDGHVWLSTLDHVRTCDSIRADSDEATVRFNVDGFDSENTDKSSVITKSNLNSLGIKGKMRFHGDSITMSKVHPDAFIFCSSESPPTEKLVRVFGRHCVKIDCVPAFFNAVSVALMKVRRLSGWDFDRVKYIDTRRVRHGDNVSVESIVFSGPAGNSDEFEVRFFWPVQFGESIEPFELYVPNLSDICTLVRT